jgi:hypothetical protein
MFDAIVGVESLRRRARRQLPRTIRRRQRPNPLVGLVPVAAAAGLAVVAGLLLWNERGRAAMRRRLQEVGGSVSGSANRVTPATPVGAGRH